RSGPPGRVPVRNPGYSLLDGRDARPEPGRGPVSALDPGGKHDRGATVPGDTADREEPARMTLSPTLAAPVPSAPEHSPTPPEDRSDRPAAKPMLAGPRPRGEAALVYALTVIPMIALVAAVLLAWGWGLS